MGFWEYKDIMTADMKKAIMDTISEQMRLGWTIEQIEPLFHDAAKQAIDELKNN